MTVIHLATGLAMIEDHVLLVASRYANHDHPLWNLPGGRQQSGELLTETVEREVMEETGLRASVGPLAYISESYDGAVHYVNFTFDVEIGSTSQVDWLRSLSRDDHVVGWEWVPLAQLSERIGVAVVREPLLAYLRGELTQRYAGFHDAGITIEWPPGSE